MIGLMLVFVVAGAAASDSEPWTTEPERFAGEYSLQRAVTTRGIQGRILLDVLDAELDDTERTENQFVTMKVQKHVPQQDHQ